MFSELGRTACAGILTVAVVVCVSPMEEEAAQYPFMKDEKEP